MEFITGSINRKIYVIGFLIAIIMGILVSFIGIYTLGIIGAVVGVLVIAKMNINAKTTFILSTLLLYVNVLKPFGGYKILSSALDAFIVILILKYFLMNGIKKENAFWLFLVTTFLTLSILEMFNPNIPSLSAGLQGLRKTSFAFLLFYLGILSFKNVGEVRAFLAKMTLISLPLLLYGVKQYFFISEFDKIFLFSNDADIWTGMLFGRPRATSVFAGSFHFGMFGAIIAVVSLFLMDSAKKKSHKFFCFVSLIIAMAGCYTSLTRTNLIALVVGVMVYKIIQFKTRNILILLPIAATGLTAIVSYILSNTYTLLQSSNELVRMIGTIANMSNDTRFLGRTHGWETVFALIREQPILAYGTGSAGDTLQNVYNFQYHVTSHNFFLKILMETGFIGLFLIVVLYIGVTLKMIKRVMTTRSTYYKRLVACCLSVLAIFMINALVGSTIETYPVSGLILLIMGIGISDFSNTNLEQEVTLADQKKRRKRYKIIW